MITSEQNDRHVGEFTTEEITYHIDANVDVRGYMWEDDSCGGRLRFFVGCDLHGNEVFADLENFLTECDKYDQKYGKVR